MPQNKVMEKQSAIIDELKEKLDIKLDDFDKLSTDDLRQMVDSAVGRVRKCNLLICLCIWISVCLCVCPVPLCVGLFLFICHFVFDNISDSRTESFISIRYLLVE